MEGESRRRVVAGTILVVVGIGLLILQVLEGAGQASWLLFLGAAFIVGYVYRQTYGFLVAGGVIAGVGLGQLGEELLETGTGIGSLGIGLGFLSIYLIDRLNRSDAPWWPLIPGGILVVTGIGDLGQPFADTMDYIWPALLIVIGLALLSGIRRERRRDHEGTRQ